MVDSDHVKVDVGDHVLSFKDQEGRVWMRDDSDIARKRKRVATPTDSPDPTPVHTLIATNASLVETNLTLVTQNKAVLEDLRDLTRHNEELRREINELKGGKKGSEASRPGLNVFRRCVKVLADRPDTTVEFDQAWSEVQPLIKKFITHDALRQFTPPAKRLTHPDQIHNALQPKIERFKTGAVYKLLCGSQIPLVSTTETFMARKWDEPLIADILTYIRDSYRPFGEKSDPITSSIRLIPSISLLTPLRPPTEYPTARIFDSVDAEEMITAWEGAFEGVSRGDVRCILGWIIVGPGREAIATYALYPKLKKVAIWDPRVVWDVKAVEWVFSIPIKTVFPDTHVEDWTFECGFPLPLNKHIVEDNLPPLIISLLHNHFHALTELPLDTLTTLTGPEGTPSTPPPTPTLPIERLTVHDLNAITASYVSKVVALADQEYGELLAALLEYAKTMGN